MMAPTKMKLRVRKREGQSSHKSSQPLADASPDSKCPICLDRFNNVASLDRCLHRFCFRCIHEWSKNKAECPLCKQPFHSIFHSVKAENDFKEFVLRPAENGEVAANANPNPPDRSLRPRGQRTTSDRRSWRQQAPPQETAPDNGVMFENLPDAASLAPDRGAHRLMLRLVARRRAEGEGWERDMVAFRRALYRTGVRVRSVRDAGRHRDISAAYLRRNAASLQRLAPWLRRELTVLYGAHGDLVNVVQHVVMSRVTHYNMEEGAIRDELRPFLLARTDHFLHELVSFARSSLSMEAYDRNAVYDCPAPSYEEGSGSDSSVIAISEDEENDNAGETEHQQLEGDCVTEPGASMATSDESGLSLAVWDDETPGPSYSTLSPSLSQSVAEGMEGAAASPGTTTRAEQAACTSSAQGQGEGEEEEEECMIVGYVKPMAERTPELVQLSSDSSEDEDTEKNTEKATLATESSPGARPPSSLQSSLNLPPLSPSFEPSVPRFPSSESQRDYIPLDHRYTHHTHAGQQDDGGASPPREDHQQVPGSRSQALLRSGSGERWSEVLALTTGHSGSRDVQAGSGELSKSCPGSRQQTQSRSRSRERTQKQSKSREKSTSKRPLGRSVSRESLSCEPSKRKRSTRLSSSRERSSHSWSESSPSVSVRSDSSASCSPSRDRAHSRHRKRPRRKVREGLRSRSKDLSSSYWDTFDQYNRERDRERGRKRKREKRIRSPSPRSDSLQSPDPSLLSRSPSDSSRRESWESGRQHSGSPSSSDSRSERSRHDKPGGKRKYKTRHLERAAEGRRTRDKEGPRQMHSPRERHRGQAPRDSRSPSVEIVYERRAPDTFSHSHTYTRQRKKRKHKRKRKEQLSPTIITIDSDSDRTIDCMDRVLDVAEPSAGDGSDHELTLSEHEGGLAAVPAVEQLFGEHVPTRLSDHAPGSHDNALNLSNCVVDVVDHSPLSPLNAFDCPMAQDGVVDAKCRESRDDSGHHVPSASGRSSDSTLLESILQELQEVLPQEGSPKKSSSPVAAEVRPGQEERVDIPPTDQAQMTCSPHQPEDLLKAQGPGKTNTTES